MSRRRTGFLGVVLVWSCTRAHASGFAFYEQGAKASGQAGAWIARADDAAANWYNPAALVCLERREVQIGLNYVDIGADSTFRPAGGAASIDAVSNASTPFHAYFSQRVGPRVAWGVGINNPFGLVSEWDQPPMTFSSRRAELRTYLVNPNAAFAVNGSWSIGFGIDYLWAEVSDLSRDVVLGPAVALANVRGDGDAWGYNVGFQFKRESFSIAAGYRSDLDPELDGTFDVSGPAGAALDSTAHAKANLPGQFLMGAAYTHARFDVELAAYHTQWNVFKELAIDTGNPATSIALREDWSPTWSYRLGVAVRLGTGKTHEVRAGGVLDDSPIPVDTRRPSIPDADRTGFTVGYGYQGERIGLDAYAMYVDFEDGVAEGSLAEGVIDGVYESSALLLGATFKYRF